MNTIEYLWREANAQRKRALPILSFPAVQKMNTTVEQLVKDARLQAQAMEIVARDTDTLAAISLMDLSVEAENFGATVRFDENEIPAIVGQLVACEEDAEALKVPATNQGRTTVFVEGIRLAKERISEKPLLAGMIGPFSLAGRLMDVTEIMYACYDDPDVVKLVLEKATEYLIAYGKELRAAGADGIMMAEPLAGILSKDMMVEFSQPYVKKIVEALQTEEYPLIYHNCGNATLQMLDEIFAQGAAAYHFGNAVDMEEVLKRAPQDVICMGNVDPAAEFAQGTPESIRLATEELMRKCGSYQNFIPSSGCDIPAHTKWENIDAFFDALG